MSPLYDRQRSVNLMRLACLHFIAEKRKPNAAACLHFIAEKRKPNTVACLHFITEKRKPIWLYFAEQPGLVVTTTLCDAAKKGNECREGR